MTKPLASFRRLAQAAGAILLCLRPATAGDLLAEMAGPDLQLQLRAVRYFPSPQLRWDGWIGGGARLLRARSVTAVFEADLETVAGGAQRVFDAPQANYHAEFTARRASRTWDGIAFWHHVSRHDLDRPKALAVDWNILGARAAVRLHPGSSHPSSVELGVGRVVQTSFVAYQWEFTLRGEGDFLSRPWGQLYYASSLRAVTMRSSPALPGRGFVDLLLESGIRWRGGAACVGAFLAFEHRNAELLEVSGARSRALVGLRLDAAAACGK